LFGEFLAGIAAVCKPQPVSYLAELGTGTRTRAGACKGGDPTHAAGVRLTNPDADRVSREKPSQDRPRQTGGDGAVREDQDGLIAPSG